MENEPKRSKIPAWAWVVGCLGLLVACAVVFALGAAGLAIYTVSSSQGDTTPLVEAAVTVAVVPETSAPTVTVAPTGPDVQVGPTLQPEPTRSPSGDVPPSPPATAEDGQEAAEIDDPYAADRAAIEANVESIRQLEARQDVSPLSLTPEELRQRLEEDLLEEYSPEEARNDAITLSAFDFLAADFDLYNLLLDLLTEQIAGYYDPESDEFVIISDDGGFGPLEQVTHAHEYVHALQDQYYDLELLGDDDLGSEAAFAVQALAEGEATFVQTQFVLGGYFEPEQLLAFLEESLTVDTTILDSAPPVIVHELEFPYLGGLEFVTALYAQGGYDAIDAAWRDLPQSSEQILHPERYLAGDAPQLVSIAPLTDTLGAGWALAKEDILGEFYLREYLGQQLGSDEVDRAAEGWGGDQYAVYWHEEDQRLVMVLKLVWDAPADAADFAELFPQYPEGLYAGAPATQVQSGRCWSGSDVLCLFALGEQTVVVRAPDTGTAGRVAAAQNAGG